MERSKNDFKVETGEERERRDSGKSSSILSSCKKSQIEWRSLASLVKDCAFRQLIFHPVG